MMKLVFALVLVLGFGDLAQASSCWQSEVDPETGAYFESEVIYKSIKKEWQQHKPQAPAIGDLVSTVATVQKEKPWVNRLATGGAKHCYLGCRIAQTVNFEAADFAGWFKEWWDLRDCRARTHFEVVDYEETLLGAHMAGVLRTREDCFTSCQARFR